MEKLETKRLLLRNVEAADAELIASWKNDAIVKKMAMGSLAQVTFESQQKDIERSLENPGEEYVILLSKERGQAVGYIRINWMDSSERFGWLRFVLGISREPSRLQS